MPVVLVPFIAIETIFPWLRRMPHLTLKLILAAIMSMLICIVVIVLRPVHLKTSATPLWNMRGSMSISIFMHSQKSCSDCFIPQTVLSGCLDQWLLKIWCWRCFKHYPSTNDIQCSQRNQSLSHEPLDQVLTLSWSTISPEADPFRFEGSLSVKGLPPSTKVVPPDRCEALDAPDRWDVRDARSSSSSASRSSPKYKLSSGPIPQNRRSSASETSYFEKSRAFSRRRRCSARHMLSWEMSSLTKNCGMDSPDRRFSFL